MSDTHSHSGAAAAPAPHSIEDIKKHVRTYLIIGVALMIGTLMTVWASLINFGSREINIALALLIASTKGFLVAGFFMHLIVRKENDLFHPGFHRFLFCRADVSYFVVDGARQRHPNPLICR